MRLFVKHKSNGCQIGPQRQPQKEKQQAFHPGDVRGESR